MERELMVCHKSDYYCIYMLSIVEGGLSHNVVDWIAGGFRIPRDVFRNIIIDCGGLIVAVDDVLPIEVNRFQSKEDAEKAIELIQAAGVAYKLAQ